MQKELTNAGPLLNERGELCEAGYARRLIKAYDRRAIKAAHRIKEWDYYLIMNGRWGVALTIDDNSYMGLLGFSLLVNFHGLIKSSLPSFCGIRKVSCSSLCAVPS